MDAGFWVGLASGAVVWWQTDSPLTGLAAFSAALAIGLALGWRGFALAKKGAAAAGHD